MLAVDTNILVRDPTGDHPVQSAAARRVIGGNAVFVGTTAQALDWMEADLDFAAALPVAKAAGCAAFIRFDAQRAGAARHTGGVPMRAP